MQEEITRTERVLRWVEKDRFSLTTATIYVFLIGAFRAFLDSYVKDHGWFNIYEAAHYIFLAYPEILLGALVIYFLTKAPIRKIWNVILLGFWVLLLPPIVDVFILGEFGPDVASRYGYITIDQMIPSLKSVFINPFDRPEGIASTGQMVMFFAMMIGSALYVALKNDLIGKFNSMLKKGKEHVLDFLQSSIKVVLTYYGLFLSYWLISALQFIVRIGRSDIILFNIFSLPIKEKYYDFFYTYGYTTGEVFPAADRPVMGLLQNLAYNQSNLLFSTVFILLGIALALISLRMEYKKYLYMMLKNIRPLDTSLIVSAGFVGIASLHLIDGDFSQGWAIDPFYILHSQYVFLCLLSIFLLAQFSFLVDDIYAYKRDEERNNPLSKGKIPKYHYKQLTSAYALSALFISFVLGRWTLIISIIWILITLLISSSKISLTRFNGLIKGGVFGMLAFFTGYYTPGSWIAFYLEHADGEWIYAANETLIRTPGITIQTLILLIWVLLIMVVLASYSSPDSYLHFKLSERSKLDKLKYLILPVLFLFPLLSYFSILALILTGSLAFGTLVWFDLIGRDEIVKVGFMILLIAFSLLLVTNI